MVDSFSIPALLVCSMIINEIFYFNFFVLMSYTLSNELESMTQLAWVNLKENLTMDAVWRATNGNSRVVGMTLKHASF